MSVRNLILPFWPLMGVVAGLGVLIALQCGIDWMIDAERTLHDGPCEAVEIVAVKEDARSLAALRLTFEGGEAVTLDAAAIKAFHEGDRTMRARVNGNNHVLEINPDENAKEATQ